MSIKDKIKENEERDRERFMHEEIREVIRELKWRPYKDIYGTGFRARFVRLRLKFSGKPKDNMLVLEVFPYIRDTSLLMLDNNSIDNHKVMTVYGFHIYGNLSGNDINYSSIDKLETMKGYKTSSDAEEEALKKLEDILVEDCNLLYNKYTKGMENSWR